ncbi:MAG TPA: alanine/glycine:cation symporter family protein [Parapedobacter sp.]|uniref:alanine/glycine:cation symporter family protein n=1 Tax=Parapedobacter sp. TaxID=1958893 RepID=UPI002BDB1C6B|nr:alanine/glycine:cation symporter family protein [Parapedobacter sp.]HWK57387.1 alanine/glycine:cation symporter family protein [Parapedobacter sp.]
MEETIETLYEIIWSDALVFLCLAAGIYFSIATRFLQLTNLKSMVKLLVGGSASKKGVSSFQAFALALSGRIGTGNIAGVATAIAMGGPGAVFWMWLIAFLGSASAFVEATLGQIYKEVKDGQYRGGPAFYIEKGLGVKWYGIVFAIATILSTALFLPGVQSNSIALSSDNAFSIPVHYTGIGLVVLLGLIIIGGIKRIAKVAQVVVPFMAGGYILLAIVIIGLNIKEIPAVFGLIIRSAFDFEPAFSGMIGMAIAWGVKRGIYSNEAGQGTAPHAAAAAEVSHPAKQGLVQAFSVYVDTLFVCTATALMILFTGSFNVYHPNGDYVVQHLPDTEIGPAYTQQAIAHHFPLLGAPAVAIALLFFAFTTILAYYYMAETNLSYIDRKGRHKWAVWALRIMILAATFYGTIRTAEVAWKLGDIGVGMMAWLNLIAILLLRKPALRALKDYRKQRREGKDPNFNPAHHGIKRAYFWEKAGTEE